MTLFSDENELTPVELKIIYGQVKVGIWKQFPNLRKCCSPSKPWKFNKPSTNMRSLRLNTNLNLTTRELTPIQPKKGGWVNKRYQKDGLWKPQPLDTVIELT